MKYCPVACVLRVALVADLCCSLAVAQPPPFQRPYQSQGARPRTQSQPVNTPLPDLSALPSFDTLVDRGNKGDAYASYLVGRMYETGIGAPNGRINMEGAWNWYNQGVKFKSLNATYRLGLLETQGVGDRLTGQPHSILVQQGNANMQYAVNHGYSPETDVPVLGPKTDTDVLMEGAGTLLVGAAALVTAMAVMAPDNGSRKENTDNAVGYKTCQLQYMGSDNGVPVVKYRLGMGWQCP